MVLRLPTRQPAVPIPGLPAGRPSLAPTRQPAAQLPPTPAPGAGGGGGGTGVPEPPSDPLYGTGLHRSLRRGARAQAMQISTPPEFSAAPDLSTVPGPGPAPTPTPGPRRMRARMQAESLREA